MFDAIETVLVGMLAFGFPIKSDFCGPDGRDAIRQACGMGLVELGPYGTFVLTKAGRRWAGWLRECI